MSKFFALTVVAAIASAAAGTAQADEPTRAQVRAELAAARASGEMAALHGEDSGSAWLSSQAARDGAGHAFKRQAAPVRDAYAQALIGEDSASAYLSASLTPSTLTRAEVMAEVRQARDAGELHALIGEDSGAILFARQQAWRDSVYAGPGVGQSTVRADVSSAFAG